jgi:hypothetical protein
LSLVETPKSCQNPKSGKNPKSVNHPVKNFSWTEGEFYDGAPPAEGVTELWTRACPFYSLSVGHSIALEPLACVVCKLSKNDYEKLFKNL